MTIFNSKRFKQLAGMLKESSDDSWESTPTSGYDPDSKDSLYSLYSDVYKEKNGFRPRLSPETLEKMSTEDLKAAIDSLEQQPNTNDDYDDGYDHDEEERKEAYTQSLHTHGGQDLNGDYENAYNDALDSLDFDSQIDPKDLEDNPTNVSLPMSAPMKHSKIGDRGDRHLHHIKSLSGIKQYK